MQPLGRLAAWLLAVPVTRHPEAYRRSLDTKSTASSFAMCAFLELMNLDQGFFGKWPRRDSNLESSSRSYLARRARPL